ncbi:RNA-binding domain-containing protein [Chlorobium sp. KB01]|uniref:RNA-binding domain-containing protein n=1 Tax=Chlorobium sp. KB01 TaxID=1917528 RepID=UPI00097586B2|nr:RNA-binding domain-containing protein [Chlorobium sp. KB01]
MKITELIQQPEGRRVEFKETLPTVSDLAKTIVAFANDAGGDLFIGIKNEPREITGISEDEVMLLEEQISNLIHDHCYPVIIPEISFHGMEGRRFIKVRIYRGSNLPYYLKSKGKQAGTYIRVGSSNRQADSEIIDSLERQRRNISFDSEPVYDKSLTDISLEPFQVFFREKTGETLTDAVMRKLELLKDFQGSPLPTNAYVLFSDSSVKQELFPYAKIECARFKGRSSHEFIDQKTVADNIAFQAEAAYSFVLRHINKGASVNGVYTESRWEYPVVAIREALRNAVVHRDYSLSGKDIKVAIYDDMLEITSPGQLLPSIDFNEMDSRQSDIRNKVIAPVFKKLGIIDQWGNGLKLIADELKEYPEIEFKWFERGLQFQVQFLKKDYKPDGDARMMVENAGDQFGVKSGPSWDQVRTKLGLSREQVRLMLIACEKPMMIQELMIAMGWKHRSKFREKYVTPLLEENVLAMTIPHKPTSSRQQYCLTEKGRQLLADIRKRS